MTDNASDDHKLADTQLQLLMNIIGRMPVDPTTLKKAYDESDALRKITLSTSPKEAFIGPPAPQIWDNWTPEQHQEAHRLVEVLDGVKHYMQSGQPMTDEHRKWFEAINQKGGLDPDTTTLLARYRMAQIGMQPPPENAPRLSDISDEEKAKKAQDYFTLAPEARNSSANSEKQTAAHVNAERFYDMLAKRKKSSPYPEVASPSMGNEDQ